MADATKSLDVPGVWVIVKFPSDVVGMFWYQRLAVLRISPDRWVMLTPDYDLEVVDLDTQAHHAVGRNTPFSRAQDSYVYAFGPLTNGEIQRHEMLARGYQAVAGDGAIEEKKPTEWVVCDPSDDCFCNIVPEDVMGDRDAAVEFGGQGVVDWCGELRFVERVVREQTANYVETRRTAYLEGINRPIAGDSGGIRAEHLRELVSELAVKKILLTGWPPPGTPAELEVITSVSELADPWKSLHSEWLRATSHDSGMSPHREHRNLIDALSKIVKKDVIRKTGGGGGGSSSSAGGGGGGHLGSGRGKGRDAGGRGERGAGRGYGDAAGGAAGGRSP
jgi:hypothetical protein